MTYTTEPTKAQGNNIPPGYKYGQLPNFDPQMLKIFQQMSNLAGPDSYLSKIAGGDEETFKQIEAPQLKQFQGKLGNIGSEFSGAGMGSRKSSGFKNAASNAINEFSLNLQNQRQELMTKAITDLMGYQNMILNQKPYDQFLVPKNPTQ